VDRSTGGKNMHARTRPEKRAGQASSGKGFSGIGFGVPIM
jgi:hypothetical protein